MHNTLLKKIVLGTAQIGLDYGINNKAGQITCHNAMAILDAAYSNGIHFLDTAAAYGTAHDVIGSYHKRNPHRRFLVNTKFPHDFNEPFDELINQYLEQLHVAQIDTVFFHSLQSYNKCKGKIEKLLELRHNALIRNIGISVYNNEEAESLLSDAAINVIQLPYNLFDNAYQRGALIDQIKSTGKTVQTRSTFLQGLFFSNTDVAKPVVVKALRQELKLLDQIANGHSISKYELAILYCFANKSIDQVLIGVDSLQQFNELFTISEQQLLPSVVESIDHIIIKNTTLLNPCNWNKL